MVVEQSVSELSMLLSDVLLDCTRPIESPIFAKYLYKKFAFHFKNIPN
jgi:hypothetical protein